MNHYQGAESQKNRNFNNAKQQQPPQPQEPPAAVPRKPTKKPAKKCPNAYVKILEQPASKAIRFRYECERRTAGTIVGVNSTAVLKTYPTIEVVGYKGRAVVVVSCVTKDAPYRPHPYSLTGKEGCRKGVCTVEINNDNMRYVFNNLGIQCVRKKDIVEALQLREEIRVDPYKTGYAHRSKVASIDLNALRLCFQVFAEDDNGRFTIPFAPVVSDPILNRNAAAELTITDMCCSGTVLGNSQIMLLCEKVCKDDITVRFYEERNGRRTWEAFASFLPSDVHKQTAIALKTPRYHDVYVTKDVKVHVQLRRPSDGEVSEPWPFTYKPLETNVTLVKRKYAHGKRADDDAPPQANAQQESTNNPNISDLISDGKKVLPLNNLDVYARTSAQMTPSPQPTSPTAFQQNYQNAFKPSAKTINQTTPPKSPHEDIAMGYADPTNVAPTTSKALQTFNEYNFYNAYDGSQQPLQLAAYAIPLENAYQQPHQAAPLPNVAGNVYYNANTWDQGYANILRDVNNGNLAAFTAAAINNFYNSNSNNQHFNLQPAIGMPQPTTQLNYPANNHMQARQWQQWALNDHQQVKQRAQQQQQTHLAPQPAHQIYHPVYPHATKKIVSETKGYENFEINNLNATIGDDAQRTTLIGDLLNLGSEELRKIDGEEQDILTLTTDELQLSNLYISA